jgi:FkbM family methyltransferase
MATLARLGSLLFSLGSLQAVRVVSFFAVCCVAMLDRMRSIPKLLSRSYYRARGYFPTKIAGQDFRCHPQHLSFWRRLRAGRWEPETFAILDTLEPMSVYWDLGAWIGPTVLYAARKARHVVCLEPDPAAYEFLLANVRLNRLTNVTPLHLALGARSGLFPLGNRQALGDSCSSLLCTEDAAETVRIPCVSLETLLELCPLPPPNLIKMDVEGAEFDLLPQMQPFLHRHKPALYVSLHAPYLPAEARREKLQQVRDVLRMYGRCFNARQERMSHDALTGAAAHEQFVAFFLRD